MPARVIIGCMSGTSIDAVDAALVRITGRGYAIAAAVLRTASQPMGAVAAPLRRLACGEPMRACDIASAADGLARLHIATIAGLLGEDAAPVERGNATGVQLRAGKSGFRGVRPNLIVVHGQTVFHAPPLSWQLISPAPIAHAFGVPVLFDLRATDLAAGGQGAPITPLADFVMFRSADETRAVVNLGGFANFTRLPRGVGVTPAARPGGEGVAGTSLPDRRPAKPPGTTGEHQARAGMRGSDGGGAEGRDEFEAAGLAGVSGGDICACNQLLDAIARAALGQPFDRDGAAARAGAVQPAVVDMLAALLRGQSRAGRSLGTGDEMVAWVERNVRSWPPGDVARSACEAIAGVIVERIGPADRVLLAGGGAKNAALREAIEREAGTQAANARRAAVPVQLTDEFGVPADFREAAAMAVLGAICQDRLPITLRQVTGATETSVARCRVPTIATGTLGD